MKEVERDNSYPGYPAYPAEDNLKPNDLLAIIKLRKWSLILPAFIIIVSALTVATVLPSIYRSEATIIIEEKDVPEDFVRSPTEGFAEQRLQMIHHRIMSAVRLKKIIDNYDLYSEFKGKLTTDELVEKMRTDTLLTPISVEVMDRRTGRPSMATIAFTLSYEGKEPPEKIQEVAKRITDLFLEENLRSRVARTAGTADFIEAEAKRVKKTLDQIENRIASFKKENINMLPELLSVNLQAINNMERRIDEMNEQLKSQKQQEGYLQTQLANVSPMLASQNSDQQRLITLKATLANLQTKFTDSYPDVIKLKAEIANLENQMKQMGTQAQGGKSSVLPDNPAYINLASQLSSTSSEINTITQQLTELNRKKEKYEGRVAASPHVEEQYKAIIYDRDSAKTKYDDLMSKLMEANVSHGLEKEQKGERFTLSDPPKLPEKPFKPNRMGIAVIGIVLGIGAGVGMATLSEVTDDTARNADDLIKAGMGPVLAGIPLLVTHKHKRRSKKWLFFTVGGVFLLAGIGVLAMRGDVMDIEPFLVMLMRKVASVLG